MKIPKKHWKRINDALSYLDSSYNIKYNVVKLSTANTLNHELAKCAKAYELISDGNIFITEAIFKNGQGRADIFDVVNLRVYEILHSETEKEALSKITKYPEGLDIVFLKSEDVLNECEV